MHSPFSPQIVTIEMYSFASRGFVKPLNLCFRSARLEMAHEASKDALFREG